MIVEPWVILETIKDPANGARNFLVANTTHFELDFNALSGCHSVRQ